MLELHKAVEALRRYLREAPAELLNEEFAKIKAMDIQGPTLCEYLVNNPAWQLHIAEQQLIVARKALKELALWTPQLQQDVDSHDCAMIFIRSRCNKAARAIQEMRNLKRK